MGRAGLFLQGQVTPELEGVEISIRKSTATEPLITVLTDLSGTYRYQVLKKLIFFQHLLLSTQIHILKKFFLGWKIMYSVSTKFYYLFVPEKDFNSHSP